jgi:hypothetical protein
MVAAYNKIKQKEEAEITLEKTEKEEYLKLKEEYERIIDGGDDAEMEDWKKSNWKRYVELSKKKRK